MPRPSGVTVMSHHSTAFEVERPVPAGDAVKDLLPGTHAPAVIRKFNFRKALMAGAAVAVLVGDNGRGKAGQVLARIDQREFRVALDQAKADVAAADAAIASKQAQLGV